MGQERPAMQPSAISTRHRPTVALAVLLVASTGTWQASAQEQSPITKRTGLELGLDIAYSLPQGDLRKDKSLSDVIGAQVPIQLDIGYRESERMTYGVFFQYGFGKAGDKFETPCDASGAQCGSR